MSGTLVIARRELSERRFVFGVAFAIAALTLIIPILPGIHADSRREVLVILSTLGAVNVTIVLAAILGATIVGREMTERRLSFYFSKPLPATAIWFGKLIAGLVLVFVSGLIIAAPALFAGVQVIERIWPVPNETGALLPTVFILPIAVFLLAHVVATFIRSRSAWIVLDFIAASLCGAVLWLLAQQLIDGFAFGLVALLTAIFVAFAAIAIIAAGAWQLTAGRTDRLRNHRELSRFLWTSIGGGVLIVAAYVAWVVSVTPADVLRGELIVPAYNRSWVLITGIAKHRGDYHAAFLYRLDDGRAVRLPQVARLGWQVQVHWTDGNVAYWAVPARNTLLWKADLNVPSPKAVATRIAIPAESFFLSRDGTRLLLIGRDGLLTAVDVATAKSLGSARIQSGGANGPGFFIDDDRALIFGQPTGAMRPVQIWEYDVKEHKVTATGQFPRWPYKFDRDHVRALLPIENGFEVRDARTGTVLHSIPGQFSFAKFLRDGRIAAIERDNAVLWIFTSEGVPLRTIELPLARGLYPIDFGGGRVVVASRWPDTTCVVVDVDQGKVLRVEQGLRPLMWGVAGPRLLCRTDAGVVLWNPETGEKRLIAGRS